MCEEGTLVINLEPDKGQKDPNHDPFFI